MAFQQYENASNVHAAFPEGNPAGGATIQGDAYTVGDAVNIAERRRIALQEANAKLQAIAELHGD